MAAPVPQELYEVNALLKAVDELGEGRRIRETNRIHWLYRILDTLDAKTGQLLALDGMILTAMVFVADMAVGLVIPPENRLLFKSPPILLILFPVAALLCGLKVFKVSWRFLPLYMPNPRKNEARNWNAECAELAKVVCRRTTRHRCVAVLTYMSLFAFVLSLGVVGLAWYCSRESEAPHVTGHWPPNPA